MDCKDGLEIPKPVDLLKKKKKKKKKREKEKLAKSPAITETVRKKGVCKLSTWDHSGNSEDT